jgi:hypothetical protein
VKAGEARPRFAGKRIEDYVVRWLADRFAGAPAPRNC